MFERGDRFFKIISVILSTRAQGRDNGRSRTYLGWNFYYIRISRSAFQRPSVRKSWITKSDHGESIFLPTHLVAHVPLRSLLRSQDHEAIQHGQLACRSHALGKELAPESEYSHLLAGGCARAGAKVEASQPSCDSIRGALGDNLLFEMICNQHFSRQLSNCRGGSSYIM